MINPPTTQSTVDMLAQLQTLLRWTAEALVLKVNALNRGETDVAKDTSQIIRELKQALALALNESNNVETIAKSLAAASNAAASGYDLDAARDEIGRRLSKLRAARDGGGVSGPPE